MKSEREHLREEAKPNRTSEENVDRRTLLKTAAGAGIVAAAGMISARAASAQTVTNPLQPVCDSVAGSLRSLCPPEPSCALPIGLPDLAENQVGITVPQGRQVIVTETTEPVADIVVRVPARAGLVSIPSILIVSGGPLIC